MSARQPRRISLPLWKNEWAARDEIIAAVEPLVRPHLRGMTWTRWRARFGPVCADMAAAGVSPAEAVEALQALRRRWGRPVWSMNVVQAQVASMAAERGVSTDAAEEGYDIRPLGEIIAEQRAAGVYSGTIRQPLPAPL